MHIQGVSECQSEKLDWSRKNADFFTLIGCHGSVPWEIKKAQWGEQALTPVYQTWNFGEDRFISFWETAVRKSTIKNVKNKEKNIRKIYSPFSKFAERAKSVF